MTFEYRPVFIYFMDRIIEMSLQLSLTPVGRGHTCVPLFLSCFNCDEQSFLMNFMYIRNYLISRYIVFSLFLTCKLHKKAIIHYIILFIIIFLFALIIKISKQEIFGIILLLSKLKQLDTEINFPCLFRSIGFNNSEVSIKTH
jgi:hypothetical protein